LQMQMAASTAARDYQKRPALTAEVASLARACYNAEQAGRAFQLSPQEASRLIAMEDHLQSRVARSGCTPAPFNACFVPHDRCAVVVHMRTPVLYHGIVDNVRRWCGSDILASLSRWGVVNVQDLEANESTDTEGTDIEVSS